MVPVFHIQKSPAIRLYHLIAGQRYGEIAVKLTKLYVR